MQARAWTTSGILVAFGLLFAVTGSAFLFLYLAANPYQHAGTQMVSLLSAVGWLFWALLGALGYYFAESRRSTNWLYLMWVSIGGLLSAVFLSAFALIYFFLPTVLVYGASAMRADESHQGSPVLGLLGRTLLAILVAIALSAAQLMVLQSV